MSKAIKSTYTNKEYDWHTVPRYVHWRHGRIAQTYTSRVEEYGKEEEGLSPEEIRARDNEGGNLVLERMSDDELRRLEAYMTDVLKHGLNRQDISDVPDADFWFLWTREVFGAPDAPVETTEGVTTADAISKSADGPVVPPVREDVPDVRDSGLAEDGATQKVSV